jgi:hypothetical protein
MMRPYSPNGMADMARVILLPGLMVLPLVLGIAQVPIAFDLRPNEALGPLLHTERPLSVRSLAGTWAILAVVSWFVLAYRSRRVKWWEGALILAAGALSLMRLGNVWLLAIALLAPLTRQLVIADWPRAAHYGAFAVLVVVNTYAFFVTSPYNPPAPIAPALQRATTANPVVLASMDWADALQRAVPNARVLATGDPRQVEPSYWEDYRKVSLTHVEWLAILARRGVNVLVLDPLTQERAASLARVDPAFRVLYDGPEAVVVERLNP